MMYMILVALGLLLITALLGAACAFLHDILAEQRKQTVTLETLMLYEESRMREGR